MANLPWRQRLGHAYMFILTVEYEALKFFSLQGMVFCYNVYGACPSKLGIFPGRIFF